MFYNTQGNTPLDFALSNNATKSINLLICLIFRFYNHSYFNFIVDKQLCSLIEKGIDLNEYFESEIPAMIINRKEYPP